MIIKTIKCDFCGNEETESKPDEGWAGWGQINGMAWNDRPNPNLCPECLKKLKERIGDGLD